MIDNRCKVHFYVSSTQLVSLQFHGLKGSRNLKLPKVCRN